MSVFTVKELQKMNKDELITIIGNYISDQEIWLNQAKELEKQNDKKNAEIERLTEDWKQRINKARQRQFNNLKKEELASAYEKLIESLEDELERRQIDYTELQKQVDTKTEHLEKTLDEIDRLKTANAKQQAEIEQLKKRHGVALLRNDDLDLENYELKKQVDELKEQRDVFKRLFENCNNSSIKTDEIINTMNSFYREQAEHLAGLKIEQAVKDTAKEIYDKCIAIDKATGCKGFVCIEAIAELAKGKGVEVE